MFKFYFLFFLRKENPKVKLLCFIWYVLKLSHWGNKKTVYLKNNFFFFKIFYFLLCVGIIKRWVKRQTQLIIRVKLKGVYARKEREKRYEAKGKNKMKDKNFLFRRETRDFCLKFFDFLPNGSKHLRQDQRSILKHKAVTCSFS
jgi:hypothetical protein